MPPPSAPQDTLPPAPKRATKRRPQEPRSVPLVVRFRPSERDWLAARADAVGVSLADLIRRRVLEWEIPQPERSAEDARLYGVLHAISLDLRNAGSNLSGLARAYHSGFPLEDTELVSGIGELRSQVDALRRALAGG